MDIREHVIKLNETRLRVWEEGKALLDECAGREMTGEERQKWERINERLDEIDAQRDSFVSRETREQEQAVAVEALNRQLGEAGAQRKTESEADQLRSFLRGETKTLDIDVRQAMREKELIRGGASPDEVRALAWDTGSVASAVPTTLSRSLYEYLESSIAAFKLNTTKINTSAGESMQFPKLAAHAIATQVSGQGTTLAGTDPTFDKMTLDAFKYGELVKVSSEVLQDTAIDIVSFITRDIGRALGRKIDTDLVAGSGSGQPNGIMTAIGGAGTIATGGSLIDPTYEKLVDLVYSVNDEYRSNGAQWLMRDLTAGVLRKLRDGEGGTVGAVLWEPSLTAGIQNGQPDRLLGFPVYTDPNVASLASNAKVIAFGDFSAYYVRTVGAIQLESDTSRYFDTDEVGFRGKWRVDGDCIDTTAYNIIKRSV